MLALLFLLTIVRYHLSPVSGMTPTATPLITPRITTRESLFLDFEDVEKQIMAGEENIQ